MTLKKENILIEGFEEAVLEGNTYGVNYIFKEAYQRLQ